MLFSPTIFVAGKAILMQLHDQPNGRLIDTVSMKKHQHVFSSDQLTTKLFLVTINSHVSIDKALREFADLSDKVSVTLLLVI